MSDIDDEKYLRFQDAATAVEMRNELRYRGKLMPEHSLCMALLEDAIESLKYVDGTAKQREVRRDSIAWIKGEIAGAVSFVQVCDLLSATGTIFDADAIRDKLLKQVVSLKGYKKLRSHGMGRSQIKGSKLCLHLKASQSPEQTILSSQAS